MEQLTEEGRVIVGSSVTTNTFCKRDANGRWLVTMNISQERLLEGDEEWEKKNLAMKADAKELEVALANVILSVDKYLTPRSGDLFSEPMAIEIPEKTETGEWVN